MGLILGIFSSCDEARPFAPVFAKLENYTLLFVGAPTESHHPFPGDRVIQYSSSDERLHSLSPLAILSGTNTTREWEACNEMMERAAIAADHVFAVFDAHSYIGSSASSVHLFKDRGCQILVSSRKIAEEAKMEALAIGSMKLEQFKENIRSFKRVDVFRKLGLDEASPLIVFLGGSVSSFFLLSSFLRVIQKKEKVQLLIISSPDFQEHEERSIIKYKLKNVTFCPATVGTEEAISAATLVLSKDSPYILYALAAGIPAHYIRKKEKKEKRIDVNAVEVLESVDDIMLHLIGGDLLQPDDVLEKCGIPDEGVRIICELFERVRAGKPALAKSSSAPC